MSDKDDHRLVYSTDTGRVCPECGNSLDTCNCKKTRSEQILGDGRVRISKSTSGRKGKAVTVITGLPLKENDLKSVAKDLRKKCGSGGSVKDGTIEIQGDHRELLLKELIKRGWEPKISGG